MPNLDIAEDQKEYLGAGFIQGISSRLSRSRLAFITPKTFAPLKALADSGVMEILRSNDASHGQKEAAAELVIAELEKIVQGRPLLAEAFNNKLVEAGSDWVEGIKSTMQSCLDIQDLAEEGNFAATSFGGGVSIILAPANGFDRKRFIVRMFGGAYTENRAAMMDIPGGDKDYARLMTLHEVGHAESGGPVLEQTTLQMHCNNALKTIEQEIFADEFMLDNFDLVAASDQAAVLDVWLMARAGSLYREANLEDYTSGMSSRFHSHATALALMPERSATSVSSEEYLAFNVMATSMIRGAFAYAEYNMLTPEDRLATAAGVNASLPAGFDYAAGNPESMIAAGGLLISDIETFCAVAEGLLERDSNAFADMPVAKDLVTLFVRGAHRFIPDAIAKMGQGYIDIKEAARNLPEDQIIALKRAITSSATERNFCRVEPVVVSDFFTP
ncbi:MAG: hypothetical protein GC136_09630 [Alphaproteobacteria bacterium]|nr:hypothetical protein [Alphaproteobacteria bacterium]